MSATTNRGQTPFLNRGQTPVSASLGQTAAALGTVPFSGLRWPLFLGAILLAFALHWPTLASILTRWTSDPTYSHGYLVAAIAGWMTWRVWRRGELENTRASWLGIAMLAAAGAVWLLARGASIQVIEQLALPALLLGTAWALFGWRGFVALLVPIGVLYFVLPAWDYLRAPLQDMTVDAVGGFLHAVGIPAYIHGHRVDLPGGSFEIVEGCSGLHFFMAAGALAAIQAYLYIGAHWARAVLMAAALLVAIVANWIRVAAVIIAGHLTEMQHFLINDHYYFGWVVFAILMIPVLYLGHRLEERAPPRPAPAPRPALSAGLPPAHRAPVVVALVILSLPGLAWWGAYAAAQIDPPPTLPTAAGDWRLAGDASPDWAPLKPGAAAVLSGRYEDGLSIVDAWVAWYPRQSTGHELIGYGNRLARTDDGRLAESAPGEARLATGRHHDRLIRYRYEIGGRATSSALRAKLYQLQGNLGGRPSAYGTFLSARCMEADCADARAALRRFEAAMAGRLPALGTQ